MASVYTRFNSNLCENFIQLALMGNVNKNPKTKYKEIIMLNIIFFKLIGLKKLCFMFKNRSLEALL